MSSITLTLEVFYKTGPINTVDNLDRVQYGPFDTRDAAMEGNGGVLGDGHSA